MRYPIVRYVPTADDRRLCLHMMDGTARIAVFGSAKEARLALRPGQAEAAAAAVLMGRLPIGCVHVKAASARPVAELRRETFEISDPRCYDIDDERQMAAAVARAAARGDAIGEEDVPTNDL